MRVGFILKPETWLGGRNYFRNLLTAVAQIPSPSITPVVLTSRRDTSAIENLPPLEVISTVLLDHGSPAWIARKLVEKSPLGDVLLERLAVRSGIELVSHSGPLMRHSRIASVGWIPDFQHVHLPEFFQAEELRARDRQFAALCEGCDKVIVSSECALADLRTFAPRFAGKGEVLHFVASPAAVAETSSLTELQARYDFRGPYFLLPNQFWAHKNHRVVITAMMLLKQRNQPITILATGSTDDHRQPAYFQSLLDYVEQCGVRNNLRVLGVIAYQDLSALMRHAVAFVNPSRFEGWSTSVEEAKSLGKSVILSDIAVHREQAPPFGVYFEPDDAEGLAHALWTALQKYDHAADTAAQDRAKRALHARLVEFALQYQRIVLSARRPSNRHS